MAKGAVLRKPGVRVIWTVRAAVVLRVTPVTGGGCARKFAVEMAGCAIERGMNAIQREASELQVIELSPEPRVHRMAAFTRHRKSAPAMIENRRRKLLGMARVAIGAQAYELARSGVHVAVLALRGCVCSH